MKEETDIDEILNREYPHLNWADASMEYGHRIGVYSKKDLDEYHKISEWVKSVEEDDAN